MAENFYGSSLFRQWSSDGAVDREASESGETSTVLDGQDVSEPRVDALNITWAAARHVPEIAEIETICFSCPYSEKDFYKWLANPGRGGLIVENEDGEILGYIFYRLFSTNYEITTIAVLPEHRNRGVGRMLINDLRKKLKPDARKGISLKVDERNLGCQLFLKKLGFIWSETLKSEDEEYDKYLFTYQTHFENF